MKKTDARREKLNSLATRRRNLAIQKLEKDEQKRTDIINKNLQDKRATFQRFKAKKMFKNVIKLSSSEQKVIKRFSPSQSPSIFEQVAIDFEHPLPEVLTLKPGDMVTVYKKGLGLISHKWCSGEFLGRKGIFPQDILNASDIYNQMYKRSEEIRLKKEILENKQDELEWKKQQANIKECTFAPKIKKSNVYITLPVINDFSREDLSRFQKEFGGKDFVPLIITSGQMVKILKKGLGSTKKWYYGQLYDKRNQKGYFPYRCIDHHGHVHFMHARDHKNAIYRNKLRSEKEEEELQIYSFKPKINKHRQEMYLGKNYKHARILRENKRRLRQLKDANEELTFQPNIYRPTRAKVNTNVTIVTEDDNRNNIHLYEEFFGKSQPKRMEPSHIEHRIRERGNLGLKKAYVTRSFRFARPGAAAEVLIADFGLKHPIPLELYAGDKVTVLENGVGKNGKWSLGHLGNITGVFPTSCIKQFPNNEKKTNDAKYINKKSSANRIAKSVARHAYNALDRKTKKMPSKTKKERSVTFGETNTKKSNIYRRPKLFNGARTSGMKKQSPKEKFLKKSVSPVKVSKKDPLWPGSIEILDESYQFKIAKLKSQASTISQPIVLTQKENKKLFALRKRVKQKLEKIPKLHSDTEKDLYRSDFTNWLVNSNLIENETRRVVDSFFELIATDGQENISFRDISRSLHDIKIKRSKDRSGKRDALAWV